MGTMEEELLAALEQPICAGDVRVLSQAEKDAANRVLLEMFPWSGSWPDWSATLNHQRRQQDNGSLVDKDFRLFFDDCLQGRFTEVAYFANDALDLALLGTVAKFRDYISAFIDTLQTNYFFAADGRWCLTLFTDGEMNYGETPNLK
jgi:hypothetical protein